MSRTLLAAAALAVALSASPAAAQFEGRLDYRMKGLPGPEQEAGKPSAAKQEGKITIWVSNAGTRSEMSGMIPDGKGGVRPLKIVTLWKATEPRKSIMINDEKKAYSVLDRGDRPVQHRKRKLERLGSGSVAGYACDKVRLSSEEGGVQEVCVTKALGKVSALARMSAQDDDDIFEELRAAGLDGIPVSMRSLDDDEGVTMELISAKKQAVPASMFSVPPGYKEAGMVGVFATPEQQQELEKAMKEARERMKDLTPEQRKQMEEMMKQLGGGK